MNNNTTGIRQIVIVGGGTAGWMSAAYLSIVLGDAVAITLIESPRIGTIGVGEASFNTIKSFFDYLGLDEKAWMAECDATYKLAIRYEGWRSDNRYFYHPFERTDTVHGVNLSEWWLKTRKDAEPHDYSCFTAPILCDNRRSPKYVDGSCYDEATEYYPYGYQFDAHLLARLLRLIAVGNGVERVEGEVVNVLMRENGEIDRLETAQGGELEGDLFLDCSGFQGLLINQALGEPFVSFSESLLCDAAVAASVPYEPGSYEIKPYTTATTMDTGWFWETPLYSRLGVGYVYSSAFISPDDAERAFFERLGACTSEIRPFHLKMRVGRNRNSWAKNCVSIGLASGFVEPLESTGLFMIQNAIEGLVEHFPDKGLDPALIASYNRQMADCADGIRDFLVLHYCLASRIDTDFWKSARYDLRIPSGLREKLALWKQRLPSDRNLGTPYHGFAAYSYTVMLAGLGYLPDAAWPLLEFTSDKLVEPAFTGIRQRAEHLRKTLPGHREYLESFRKV